MALTYTPPAINVFTQASQTLVSSGATARTVMLLGRAKQGPDYPVIVDETQLAEFYGNASDPKNLGVSIPLGARFAAAQQQPENTGPVQYMICRYGVQRATVYLQDAGAKNGIQLQAIGKYAGSLGNYLQAVVTVGVNQVDTITVTGTPTGGTFSVAYNGSTAVNVAYNATASALQSALEGLPTIGAGNVAVTGTGPYTVTFQGALAEQNLANLVVSGAGLTGGASPNAASVVTTPGVAGSLIVNDTSSGANVQVFGVTTASADLSSNVAIVNAVQGPNPEDSPYSTVWAVLNDDTAADVLLHAQTVSFAGGTDGTTAGPTDATIPTLLAQSLYAHVDYIVPLDDAAAMVDASGALMTHLANAVAQNEYRKVICGPKSGTTFATLTGGSYGVASSDRVVCVGHDTAYAPSPVNGLSTGYDGFYLAAAYAGLKASGPIEETCDSFALSGFTKLASPTGNLGLPLTPDQENLLGQNGFLVFDQGSNVITVRDAITTAPYSINGAINPFYQFSVRDIDDAVSVAVVAALLPFKGRPSVPPTMQAQQMTLALQLALSGLGSTINGINSVSVTYNPNTLSFTANVSYETRYPILQINVVTSYTFSPLSNPSGS